MIGGQTACCMVDDGVSNRLGQDGKTKKIEMDTLHRDEGQEESQEINDKKVAVGDTDGAELDDSDFILPCSSPSPERSEATVSYTGGIEKESAVVNSVDNNNDKANLSRDSEQIMNDVKEAKVHNVCGFTTKTKNEDSSDFMSLSKEKQEIQGSERKDREGFVRVDSDQKTNEIDELMKNEMKASNMTSERDDTSLTSSSISRESFGLNTVKEPTTRISHIIEKTMNSPTLEAKSTNSCFLSPFTGNQVEKTDSNSFKAQLKFPMLKETRDMSSVSSKYALKQSSDSEKLRPCPKCRKHCKMFDFCEECMMYFCSDCFTPFHWIQTGHTDHVIVKNVSFEDICCTTHGEVFRYYCQHCKKKKCSDCLSLSTVCMFHQKSKLSDHVQHKKTVLQEAGNKMTSQCSSLTDKLLNAIWRQEEKLKLQTLGQQERLSQEFASMRELLSEREAYLCNQMDQCLSNSLARLSNLRIKVGEELEESGDLSLLLLNIVNEPSSTKAVVDIEKFEDRGREHMDHLKKFKKSKVKQITVPDVLFSLYQEKTHLLQSLSNESFLNDKLFKAKRHTMYIPEGKICMPVRASDLITFQNFLPPSTSYTILLQIMSIHRPKQHLGSIMIGDLNSEVLNAPGLIQLRPGERYLMKFEVDRTVKLSWASEQVVREVLHIFIVTDGSMIIDKPSWSEIVYLDCSFLYRSTTPSSRESFEEARYEHLKAAICLDYNALYWSTTPSLMKSFEEARYEQMKEQSVRLKAITERRLTRRRGVRPRVST